MSKQLQRRKCTALTGSNTVATQAKLQESLASMIPYGKRYGWPSGVLDPALEIMPLADEAEPCARFCGLHLCGLEGERVGADHQRPRKSSNPATSSGGNTLICLCEEAQYSPSCTLTSC